MILLQVILGGGRQYMFPKETVDPEYPTVTGSREDKTDLVQEWLKNREVSQTPPKYIENENSVIIHLSSLSSGFKFTLFPMEHKRRCL